MIAMKPTGTRVFKGWSLVLFGITSVFAQNQSKVIQWSDHPQGSNRWETAKPPLQLLRQIDGIEIEEVLVEGTPIIMGQPFNAGPDWLNNISFRIKNVSNEKLVFVQITLTLPDLSKPPEIPYVACSRTNRVCIQPGEELQLKVPAGGLYDWVKRTVSDQGHDITTIKEARIKYTLVKLLNGAEWSSGCVKTADPKNACPNPSP